MQNQPTKKDYSIPTCHINMNIIEAKKIIKTGRCGLSTKRHQSGRITCLSYRSDLQRSVEKAVENKNAQLIEALKTYLQNELIEITQNYEMALKRTIHATGDRSKRLRLQRYNRISDRKGLFDSLIKELTAQRYDPIDGK